MGTALKLVALYLESAGKNSFGENPASNTKEAPLFAINKSGGGGSEIEEFENGGGGELILSMIPIDMEVLQISVLQLNFHWRFNWQGIAPSSQ